MQADELEEGRKRLVEKLGVYLEQDKQMAPLAARILATLIIKHDRGITFEQLVADLEASKSTVCTHLNSLIAQKKIHYFTKSGDRKRYYVLAPGDILRRIESLILAWNIEIELRKEVIQYKLDFNKIHQEDPFSVEFQREMLVFLQQSVAYFEDQIDKYQTRIN